MTKKNVCNLSKQYKSFTVFISYIWSHLYTMLTAPMGASAHWKVVGLLQCRLRVLVNYNTQRVVIYQDSESTLHALYAPVENPDVVTHLPVKSPLLQYSVLLL